MNSFDWLQNGLVLLISVPFVIVALVLFIMGLRGRRKASVSRTWPTTQGTVLAATVEARRSHSSRSGTTTSYYPIVIYEYQIDGKVYRNNTLSVEGVLGGPSSRAQQKIMQYPVGSSVTVFYDPENPQHAGLEHGTGRSTILIAIAIFILAMLAVTVAFTSFMLNSVGSLTSGLPK